MKEAKDRPVTVLSNELTLGGSLGCLPSVNTVVVGAEHVLSLSVLFRAFHVLLFLCGDSKRKPGYHDYCCCSRELSLEEAMRGNSQTRILQSLSLSLSFSHL